MRSLYQRSKSFFQKHERILLPSSLIVGFIIDSFTLTRIDKLFDNLILIGYLFIAGSSIIFIFGLSASQRDGMVGKIQTFLPYILQYSFGGLFSGLFIFYSKSANFITNLPFLIILLLLLIGNEFFHRRSRRLLFWVIVFSVALISYSILIFPVIIRSLSAITFVTGGLIGFILAILYIKLIKLTILRKSKIKVKNFYESIGVVFLAFLILYTTNSIPPVPLSIKESGVFHNIEKIGDTYIATGEKPSWYNPLRDSSRFFHTQTGKKAFIFSSIFVPTRTSGTIYHEWLRQNEKGEWVQVQKIPISITGGRDQGFRGYSWSTVTPGKWRVDIENSKGQVAGRLKFEVKKPEKPLEIISKRY